MGEYPAGLPDSTAGTCLFCGQKAGVLSRSHSQCRQTHDAGFQEMAALAAEAARTHTLDEKSLLVTLRSLPAGRGEAVPTS